ncbi:MAG: hypothetical protein RDU25_02590 [Patescibacteria group bacterium]|nr:hypothetical protein [Patescibacteria group bacterium]
MKKLVSTFFSLAIFSLVALPASAATMISGDMLSMGQDEAVPGDLYASAGNLVAAGQVGGDLLIAGGNVVSSGDVEQDIMAVGGTVDINGMVGDDVRVAGGKVNIGAEVAGDLVAVGGMVQLLPGATIKGDVYVAGGAVVLYGAVEGNVYVRSGSAILGGSIAGNTDVVGEEEVKIQRGADLRGSVKLQGLKQPVVEDGAVLAQDYEFTLSETRPVKMAKPDGAALAAFAGGVAAFGLIKFLALLAAALVLGYAFKQFSRKHVIETYQRFAPNLGWGFVALIMVPIVAGFLVITLVGSVIGLALLAAYGLLITLAKVMTALFIGALVWRLFSKKMPNDINWKVILVGCLVYQVLCLIPVIGWVLSFIAFLSVFGNLFMASKEAVLKTK